MYDAEDGLVAPPYDITVVKKLVWEYFKVGVSGGCGTESYVICSQIKQPFDILDSLYTNFKKSFIAKLCKELAEGNQSDPS